MRLQAQLQPSVPRNDLQTIHDYGEEAGQLSARQAGGQLTPRQTGSMQVDALTKTQEIYVYQQEATKPAEVAHRDELLMGSPSVGKDNISFAALDNSTDSVHIRNADALPAESPMMAAESLIMAARQQPESSPQRSDVVNMAEHIQQTPREIPESHDQPSMSQMPTILTVPDNLPSEKPVCLSLSDNVELDRLDATINQPVTPPAANRRDTLQPHVEAAETGERDTFQPTPVPAREEVSQPEPEESLTPPTRTSTIPEGQRTPATRSSWQPSEVLPLYGLDAELKAKAEANKDLSAEDEAGQWVEEITGFKVVGEFGESLRTGQVLCQLINNIKPGTIRKINEPGRPFKERENITMFIKACRDWGVHEYALFSTDDLYDEKNLSSVVKCIHQLGGVLRRAVPEYQGPHLGVADCSNAKRDAKRALAPASQTEGFRNAMGRAHIDMLSTGNVRAPTSRGGC